MSEVQLQLESTHCWDAATALLDKSLADVDVQQISDKDFDGPDLILTDTSVRLMYVDSKFEAFENQKRNYQVDHNFLALCGVADLHSVQDQARSSRKLAQRVEFQLAGARLRLVTQEISEPINLVSTVPLEVKGIGVAYCVAFTVPGPALYPAPNAYPPPYQSAYQGEV